MFILLYFYPLIWPFTPVNPPSRGKGLGVRVWSAQLYPVTITCMRSLYCIVSK